MEGSKLTTSIEVTAGKEPQALVWTESSVWRQRTAQLLRSSGFWGLIFALASWPFSAADLAPTAGIDPSWQATLEMAARTSLPFGTHVVFAYGPLGFLSVWSFYYPVTAALSFAFLLGLQSTLFAVLLGRLRQSVPIIPALLVTYGTGTVVISIVAVQFTGGPERILPLFFIACVALLSGSTGRARSPWVWVMLGGVLSLFSLVKVSLAAPLVVALGITVICLPSRRRRVVVSIAGGIIPVFFIGWFATGNGLGNLYAFARGSYDIISGYASALSTEEPGRASDYWWGALCVLIVGAFAVAHCRGRSRRIQVGISLLTLLFLWDLFREGFVRHDTFHDPVFFAAVPLLLVAFAPWKYHWAGLVIAVAATSTIAVVASGSVPSLLGRPDLGLRNAGHEVVTLASTTRRATLEQDARVNMEALYKVPESMLSKVGRSTVVVEPWEQGLVWAYGLAFDPLPAFRDAYTPYLDQLDAVDLATASAPKYILRWQPDNYGGQYQEFDRPSTQVAIECHYRQVQSDDFWQLLEHSGDRCGTLKQIGTVSAGLGEWIDVPSAPKGDDVVATFDLPLDLWWHLSNTFFKSPQITMTVNGGANVFQFIPGTGSDTHLLVASKNLGWDQAFTPLDITTLAFSVGGQSFGVSGVTAKFYEIPMVSRAGTSG
jgi:hypothetical protein